MAALRHVILFRLREGADADRALSLLRSFQPPGTTKWVIERSVDERKGVVIVEDATFESQAALDAFRVSEDDVWAWVQKERRNPTTEITRPS